MRTQKMVCWVACAAVLFTFFGIAPLAQAQGRVSDKDVQSLMRNLQEDAKAFRPAFDAAIRKSSFRKTSRARDAHALAARFEKQTAIMLNNFKRTKNNNGEVENTISMAEEINKLVDRLSLNPQTTSRWEKIKSETHQIASAFGVNDAGMAPEGEASNGLSCLETAGARRAKKLVDQCLQVSPATHPPCNVQNSCSLIISEIKRGCAYVGDGAPSFCDDYR